MKRILFLFSIFFPHGAPAEDLYTTDFENFPSGDNRWAGTEGWISNDTSSGAQGIGEDLVADLPLGKTAYLGFEPPDSAFTTVARPVNYDPAIGGVSCVEFESFLGVQDSLNGRRDQFFISFYDNGGTFLAAIVFDNTSSGGDMLRWQGMSDLSVQSTDTGVDFIRGNQLLGFISLQILAVRIDLVNNTWSAQLGVEPLFSDVTFTDPALAPLTLGSVAAEWELGIPSPSFAGDNWLFVADWFVRTAPQSLEPFVINNISRDKQTGTATITWLREPGFEYQVRYSDDLQTWKEDLPNSFFASSTSPSELESFSEDNAPARRYYVVARTPTS